MNRVLVLLSVSFLLLSGCAALQSSGVFGNARPASEEARAADERAALKRRQAELSGAYLAEVPAASAPRREIILVLYADGAARLHTDFRNNEMPVIELGSWSLSHQAAEGVLAEEDREDAPDVALVLRLEGSRELAYEQPERLVFAVREVGQAGTQLTTVEYDPSRYGKEGLQLNRYNRDPTPSISGTAWQLVEIQMMNDRVFVPTAPERYTAEFSTGGRFSARADCNRLSGSYADIDSQLLFGPIASTKALCSTDSLYQIYTDAFHAVHSYVLEAGDLYLAFGPDSGILKFAPAQ